MAGGRETKLDLPEKLVRKELELKHYQERLRLREVAISERERRLDGEILLGGVFVYNYLVCFST